MRYLFYIEPLVELENPTWKSYWLTYFVKHFYDALNHDVNAEFSCILPTALSVLAEQKFPDFQSINSIDHSELVPAFGDSAVDVARKWYEKTHLSDKYLGEMSGLITARLGAFVPDVCITFSPAPFIIAAFPKVKLWHVELGFISRPPFPQTVYFDPLGMFKSSVLSQFSNDIRSYQPMPEEKLFLSELRNSYCHNATDDSNPLNAFIQPLLQNFDSAIMLSMQFSNYYAYDAHAKFKDQYDLLIYTLENTPDNIAVVVTEHPEHTVLKPETIAYLKDHYKNFVWHPIFREIYGVSHYLMPYVQGVATVSSSVGLQAALWKKKLFVIGSSHLDAVADAYDFSDCSDVLNDGNWPIWKDALLIWLLTRFHVPFSLLVQQGRLTQYLNFGNVTEFKSFSSVVGNIGIDLNEIKEFYHQHLLDNPFSALSNQSNKDPDTFHMALYFSYVEHEYNEKMCHRKFVSLHETSVVNVEFEIAVKTSKSIYLRLDPANKPCSLLLLEMAIETNKGEIVWQWDYTVSGLGQLFCLNAIALEDQKGVLLSSDHVDPNITLNQGVDWSKVYGSVNVKVKVGKPEQNLIRKLKHRQCNEILDLKSNLLRINQDFESIKLQKVADEDEIKQLKQHAENLNDLLSIRIEEALSLNQEVKENVDTINALQNINQNQSGKIHEQSVLLEYLNKEIEVLNSESEKMKASFCYRVGAKFYCLLKGAKKACLKPIGLKREGHGLPEDFNSQSYLELNPDVAQLGVDPVEHYLTFGIDEGRPYSFNIQNSFFEHDIGNLPSDFNPDLYLQLNPDLAAAGIDPGKHYLAFGISEGRAYRLESIVLNTHKPLNKKLETILVVSHEATLTGAPVLSLNLVKEFSNQYNVICLLLGDGPLLDEFISQSHAYNIVKMIAAQPALAGFVINEFAKQFSIKFAIANSIETRYVLPALSQHLIPSICLLHEFAATTKPSNAFDFVFQWASEVVFSADITLNNARELFYLDKREVRVIPQGRCILPVDQKKEQELQNEKARIQRLMRPDSLSKDAVVILGVGTRYIRKGVDLFVDCANRIINQLGATNCRFVWIGKDVPMVDPLYSTFVTDQISRAGLEDCFIFIDETFALETAYECADIFLMTSRLDPLPNVVIDALEYELPTLCFDNTTGVVQFLSETGLKNDCVVPYLDTEQMAQLAYNYIRDSGLRKTIGAKCKTACAEYFNMSNYISTLDSLGNHAQTDYESRREQLYTDISTLVSSSLLRPDFFDPGHAGEANQNSDEIARTYILNWAVNRKPCPGFHPKVYIEQHGLSFKHANPFADFIREGQPSGPWLYEVIDDQSTAEVDLSLSSKVALHIHAFYIDLLPKIINALNLNLLTPDLFVSITEHETIASVNEILEEYKGNVVELQVVPNLGRDIGPLISLFGERICKNYKYFGHVHTKKTKHQHPELGQVWFNFLIENLIGGKNGSMMDRIFTAFSNDSNLGMVLPDDPNTLVWTENYKFATQLAKQLGIDELPDYFNFPVGTMFWAKTCALQPFVNLRLSWNDYPHEPVPMDGTLLHAIERLFPLALPKECTVAVTNVVGLTR